MYFQVGWSTLVPSTHWQRSLTSNARPQIILRFIPHYTFVRKYPQSPFSYARIEPVLYLQYLAPDACRAYLRDNSKDVMRKPTFLTRQDIKGGGQAEGRYDGGVLASPVRTQTLAASSESGQSFHASQIIRESSVYQLNPRIRSL